MSTQRLGILVGGGPAPGINAVIGAATIEAINQGFEVVGLYEGFRWLCSQELDATVHTVELTIPKVARIHFDGGSILRISRANLLDEQRLKRSRMVAPAESKIRQVLENLEALGISHVITIGGDDTALSARFIADSVEGLPKIVHVPKTIDNDLPLPHDVSTFGFSTARFWGTQIVKNLMRDSLTTGRWYLVTVMGRSAGWLALSIGQAAGATVTLIPEEFGDQTSLHRIADVLDGVILKRLVMGRPDGVALVAEGLAYRLGDAQELKRLLGKEVSFDAAGHPRLSEFPLGEMLKNDLEARFSGRGESFRMVTHTLGYELRSADPTPADMAYCRALGYGCIRLLTDRRVPSGSMVTLVNGNLVPMDFHTMIDPKTNRIQQRLVDPSSDSYRCARAYMIRLEKDDLDNPKTLGQLAALVHISPDQFHERYHHAATRLFDADTSTRTPKNSL